MSRSKRYLYRKVLLVAAVSAFVTSSNATVVRLNESYRSLLVPLQRIADGPASLEDKQNEILEYLSKYGYLQASANVVGDTIDVTPDIRFTLDTLSLGRDLQRSQRVHKYFSSGLLDSLAAESLDSLRAAGYLYANFTISEMRLHDSSASIDAEIVKGPLVRFAETRLEGLERTRPELVKRYLSLDQDSTISGQTVATVEREAAEIPFLVFNPPAEIRPLNGYERADLALSFAEKRGVLLSGGVGYGGNDSRDLRWRFETRITNLFGDGKEALVRSERREADRELLEIAYRQPLFLWNVDDLNVRVATRDYPTSFYEFTFGSSYTTRLRSRINASLALEYRAVRPVFPARSYRAISVDIGTMLRNVDNRLIPKSGIIASAAVSGTWREYGQTADSSGASLLDTRLYSSVAYYRPVLRPIVTAFMIRYSGLETSEALPPLSELLLIGGPGSLRGWNVEQFPAIRAATFTFEPQAHFRGGYWYLFYDGGWLNNREQSPSGLRSVIRYRDGFGTGIHLVSGEKGVSISLGWNRETALNDPLVGISLSTDL